VQAWANSMAGHAPATIRRRTYALPIGLSHEAPGNARPAPEPLAAREVA